MKTNLLLKLFALLFAFGIFTIACDESLDLDVPDPDEQDVSTVEDNAASEGMVFAVFENVNNYGISEDGLSEDKSFMDGEFITWDTAEYAITLNFDADDAPSGISGSIIADFDANPAYPTPGNPTAVSAEVTMIDFNEGEAAMNGTMNLVLSLDLNLQPKFELTSVGQLTMTYNDTLSTWWSGSRNILWAEGFITLLDDTDDVFHLWGDAAGLNTSGVEYTSSVAVDNPLVQPTNCDYLTQGILTIVEPEQTLAIDFGDGTCDNLAVVTITIGENEYTLDIEL